MALAVIIISLGFGKDAFGHLAVSVEGSGRRKFSQSMADHVFTNENFFVNLTVVNKKGVTDELRRNLTGPRPSLDGLFFTHGFLLAHFEHEFFVDVWSFFRASRHFSVFSYQLSADSFNNVFVTVFMWLSGLLAQSTLPPRRFG